MNTKTSDRWGIIALTGRSNEETPTRKFRQENIRSVAVLQPRRREHIPLELVTLLRALAGNESNLIVLKTEVRREEAYD
jgi:hypothetical protein